MILEVAILNVIPGREDAFLKAFARAQAIIAGMAGYLSHKLKGVQRIAASLFCWLSGKNLPTIPKASANQTNTRNGKSCYITFTTHSLLLNITRILRD